MQEAGTKVNAPAFGPPASSRPYLLGPSASGRLFERGDSHAWGRKGNGIEDPVPWDRRPLVRP